MRPKSIFDKKEHGYIYFPYKIYIEKILIKLSLRPIEWVSMHIW